MNKIKTNRLRTSRRIGDTPIEHYFAKSGGNFRGVLKDSAVQSISTLQKDSARNINSDFLLRLKDGIEGLFAKNGFELFDLTPNMPLHKFYADGQVPTRYGGGFVEQVSAFRLNFTLPQARLTGTLTNERQEAKVVEEKVTVPAYAFQYTATVTEYELMKYGHINYDIYQYRLEAMRLAYQLELEYFRFLGNKGIGDIDENHPEFVGGLLNQPDTVAVNSFYGADWRTDYSVEEFLKVILATVRQIKTNVRGDESKYPNMLLVGSDIWEAISQPAVIGNVGAGNGAGVSVSIIDYVQTQVSAITGQPFLIQENFYLNADATEDTTTAGIVANGENGLGMMVMYRYDDKVIRNHIPLALTAGAMFLTAAGWQQNHIAIATPSLVLYPSMGYIHNGTDPNA